MMMMMMMMMGMGRMVVDHHHHHHIFGGEMIMMTMAIKNDDHTTKSLQYVNMKYGDRNYVDGGFTKAMQSPSTTHSKVSKAATS